jgi:hypothetical protein
LWSTDPALGSSGPPSSRETRGGLGPIRRRETRAAGRRVAGAVAAGSLRRWREQNDDATIHEASLVAASCSRLGERIMGMRCQCCEA